MRAPRGPLSRLLSESSLRRIAVELAHEQVTFVAREGSVHALCTCGLAACTHVAQALDVLGAEPDTLMAGRDPAMPRAPIPLRASLPSGGRDSRTGLAPIVTSGQSASNFQPISLTRSSRPPAPQAQAVQQGLAELIDELVLATARAGVSHADSVSVKAALDALIKSVGTPGPLGMARFLGRFQEAMQQAEVGRVGRLLDGLAGLASALRGSSNAANTALKRAWLSTSEGFPEALSDVVLVEVAREWLHGQSRQALERRYLVDLQTGTIYGEERHRGAVDVSVGPCPRVVHVAYGEFEPHTRPRRIRLLQYSIVPEPSALEWESLALFGKTRFRELPERYARELADASALAEPFALVAPVHIDDERGGLLRDAADDRLEISDDTGGSVLKTIRKLSQDGDVAWLAGRLRGSSRGITLRPTSMLVRTQAGFSLRRVT